jgi:hypothetical protein
MIAEDSFETEEIRLVFSTQQTALHKHLGHKPARQPAPSVSAPLRRSKSELYHSVHTAQPTASRTNGPNGFTTDSHTRESGGDAIAIVRSNRCRAGLRLKA